MLARICRYGAALLLIAVATAFLPGLLRSLPAAGSAGAQSGATCAEPLSGARGRQELTTSRGLDVAVITPTDYDGQHRYGLLFMLPPAGFSRAASERFYQLTREATAAGYIVAFSNSVPLSTQAIRVQGEAVAELRRRWCIDSDRIILAGHSDGGSLAQGVLLRQAASEHWPAAILASAAGIRKDDLAQEICPAPVTVTILHSVTDERFADYGMGVAQWWARCFACEALPVPPGPGKCSDARQCTGRAGVRYCETTEAHSHYPTQFAEQLRPLLQAAR